MYEQIGENLNKLYKVIHKKDISVNKGISKNNFLVEKKCLGTITYISENKRPTENLGLFGHPRIN